MTCLNPNPSSPIFLKGTEDVGRTDIVPPLVENVLPSVRTEITLPPAVNVFHFDKIEINPPSMDNILPFGQDMVYGLESGNPIIESIYSPLVNHDVQIGDYA